MVATVSFDVIDDVGGAAAEAATWVRRQELASSFLPCAVVASSRCGRPAPIGARTALTIANDLTRATGATRHNLAT
jgi:hypothetical protein